MHRCPQTTEVMPAVSRRLSASLASLARGVVREGEPLSRRTTFGIGGPAALWFEPEGPDDLQAALRFARDEGLDCIILGGGSNVLVGDRGILGLTLHLPARREEITVEETGDAYVVTFPAGLSTAAVRRTARALGAVGPEFLVGIPGTLGGALQMNAGTRLGEMVDVVECAHVVTADGAGWLDAEAFHFGYRHAELPPGGVVTHLRLRFTKATPARIAAAEQAARAELARRHRTQPRGRSAGSVFKNPPGDYAGRLIEAAGLKGRRVGGAVISPVHANFIVNDGGATAADVLSLLRLCQARVEACFGVALKLEIKLLGEFRCP